MRAKEKFKKNKKKGGTVSIKSISKISDDYDEKYLKIKFNSDDELLLNNAI